MNGMSGKRLFYRSVIPLKMSTDGLVGMFFATVTIICYELNS